MIDVLTRSLADTDPDIQAAITAELTRRQDTLEMIASENFAPIAVMQAQGSVLTNKYAEGYPGRRYYGGCENVDVIEQLAIDRIKSLFGAEFAIIATALKPDFEAQVAESLRQRVSSLAAKHPLYPKLGDSNGAR